MHAWIKDEMKKQLGNQLHLTVAETLHIAQTKVQLLSGANMSTKEGRRQAWKSYLLAPKDGTSKKTVLNFFARLEFQDGKRKRYENEEEVVHNSTMGAVPCTCTC